MKKRIFTFWEPKEKMPEYIKLCIQTWYKFLPEYEIIILDYNNLSQWLPENYFDKTLYLDYSLPKQADAIRCALLKKYGGIWFDADTIVTSDKIYELLNLESDVIMIGLHIGFIKAKKNSKVLKYWDKNIKKNLLKRKFYKNFPELYELFFGIRNCIKLDKWDFLGNSILNPYTKKLKEKDFLSANKKRTNILPENALFENDETLPMEKYRKCYFSDRDYSKEIMKQETGMLMLHNSWTPAKYLEMSEEDFLAQNITLANIFKIIGLNK